MAAAAGQGQPSAAVVLGPKLVKWRDEIEATGNGKVILARVYTDKKRGLVHLPRDAGQRAILVRYFRNKNFLRQFLSNYATTINYRGKEGKFSFILLNMGRSSEWGVHENAVLAHEFGHVWLYVHNYASPVFEGNRDSCIGVFAGEAVQRVLVREEIERRGIPYREFWISQLDQVLKHLQQGDGPAFDQMPICTKMAQIVLWLDVRLGLSPKVWKNYDPFLKAMAHRYPLLKQFTGELYQRLRSADLHDPKHYQRTMENVLYLMYGFAEQVLGMKPPQQPAPVKVRVKQKIIQPKVEGAPGKK